MKNDIQRMASLLDIDIVFLGIENSYGTPVVEYRSDVFCCDSLRGYWLTLQSLTRDNERLDNDSLHLRCS